MKGYIYWSFLSLFLFCSQCKMGSKDNFVRVQENALICNGNPYYFMGTNFWYGMNLGMEDSLGNRARLVRELDRLQSLGITNLRILGLSEGPNSEPYRMSPAVQNTPGKLEESVLKGLDFLLVEMAKRDMKAVICLGNFWPWSGGFAQYLVWSKRIDSIPYPPPHPGGTWDGYQTTTAQFYSDSVAIQYYYNAIQQLIQRINSVSKLAYVDDPTIMSWQLANEPRGITNETAFIQWIDQTAAFIKSLDKNHLVSLGSEGHTATKYWSGTDFLKNHESKHIDYTTIHIWIENWSWYQPANHTATYTNAQVMALRYLEEHLQLAQKLNKPLIIEEFGIARDSGSLDPLKDTKQRDAYYSWLFEQAYTKAVEKKGISGINFWAWGGEGRPRSFPCLWKQGDDWIGDPPHEFQGWYSVYDKDTSTQKIIKTYASKFNSIQ
ncbi:MAG: beta-mannosidase [Cytophagaceae bacterium]|nr:beta-mannosidase [Cytophagaceae bacterium]